MITTEEKAEREAKARELFAQGLSVNKVAEQVFKGNWTAAKAVKDAMDGGAPKAGGKPGKKKSARRDTGKTGAARAAAVEEPGEDWDLTLQLPAASLLRIFAAFDDGEKATAIQAVMQARMDELGAA
jgi:hypothetical protein